MTSAALACPEVVTTNPWKGLMMNRVSTRAQVEARFWAKVDKDGPVPSHVPGLGPCWVWTASTLGPRHKYGVANYQGVMKPAHRVAWMLFGPEPIADRWVLHRCDNGRCVRPDHLFLGTAQDNYDDMASKGRARHTGPTSDESRSVKLTREQVREIRERIARGDKQSALAAEYGVVKQLISSIKLRHIWKDVA